MLFVLIEDVFPYQLYIYIYVPMYVRTYVRYCSCIWARWVVEIMKIWQLILILSIVKIFVWKPNSFLGYLFILITLVGLHNTHVLNYSINIKKKLYTKHYKTFSSSFLRSLPNTGKWDNFLENAQFFSLENLL